MSSDQNEVPLPRVGVAKILLLIVDFVDYPPPKKGTKAHVTLLGGPWDLVTTYNWDFNPILIIGLTPISPFRRIRVISPVISRY